MEEYRKLGRSGIVFKLDFKKACDHVEWGFLDFVLQKKGFGSLRRKWILGCLSTISFSIFINGRPRRDPLYPFLFTLVAHILGRLIDKAKECDTIHGFLMGKNKVEVTHLQFADDTLLFLEASHNVFLNILRLLEVFGSVSGLQVNLSKSTLLGINIDDDMLQNLASLSGCEVGAWPIKYLGLPLGGNPWKLDFWEPVVSKVKKRLDG